MPLLQPPHDAYGDAPTIFLAGPIQGGPDWQSDAAAIIEAVDPGILIASPRRAIATRGDFDDAMYREQVSWEHRYLDRAAASGTILFWLAREAEHRCDRAYAQTTRLELGIALGWHRFEGSRVVVGVEEGFSNARYIRYTLASRYPGVPVLDDLEATCRAAVGSLVR